MYAEPARCLWAAWRSSRAGVAALEFALVAPIFLALIFGIIDLSRYTFSVISVRHAAAEAVRAASLGRSSNDVQQIARTQAPFLGDALSVSCSGCVGADASAVRTYSVTATFNFSFLLPFLPATTVAIQESTQITY
ncbi:TadE-like protein [Stella humosa]|uniref:TadE-like protein n=1 Tax=Stella humosa TaxID=94 RepID=A0A3N1M5T2_9PROT|nr:TadE family protein [Stella humosa]ROQ01162.1 TadE-like protein [Stella humosa]BBK31537.1 hypothetical protein STHU_21710 [Stella humosa]